MNIEKQDFERLKQEITDLTTALFSFCAHFTKLELDEKERLKVSKWQNKGNVLLFPSSKSYDNL